MSERQDREQRSPDDFGSILSGKEQPLIVGGQAVNIWAELYASSLPALENFAPFTSVDADIYGTRALAETLARCLGWVCERIEDSDSVAVAILTKSSAARGPLKIEVLREVNGLTTDDLNLSATVEITAGTRYRIPPPLVLLKAKLYNLVSLVNMDRPQDIKHTRMLMQIVPQRFNEMLAEQRAGNVQLENLLGSIEYARKLTQTGFAGNAAHTHKLDFRELIPPSLVFGPLEVQSAVKCYLEGLPPSNSVAETQDSPLISPKAEPSKESRGYRA